MSERTIDRYDLHLGDVWCRRRWAVRLGLTLYFVAVAFYFGPSRLLFDKWTWINPGDFVSDAKKFGVPAVLALKEYQREHGRLPPENSDLSDLFKLDPHARPGRLWKGEYFFYSAYNHRVTYSFDPTNEGWYVHGELTHGPIPLPAVQLPPTTRP